MVLSILCMYAILSLGDAQMYAPQRQSRIGVRIGRTSNMAIAVSEPTKYYVLKGKAVPEVLLKVVEAKHLVESGKESSVAQAASRVGLSRSSFYKYKDDIFEFHDTTEGTTINLTAQMDDEPGRLSDVLRAIAECGANILTIHQSLPISGIATISLSIRVLPTTNDIAALMEELGQLKGMHNVKLVAGE